MFGTRDWAIGLNRKRPIFPLSIICTLIVISITIQGANNQCLNICKYAPEFIHKCYASKGVGCVFNQTSCYHKCVPIVTTIAPNASTDYSTSKSGIEVTTSSDLYECPWMCGENGKCRRSLTDGGVSCVCDDQWVGQLCQQFCNFSCGNGKCVWLGSQLQCQCKGNPHKDDTWWTGTNCTIRKMKATTAPRVETPDWYWYVVGTTISVAVILLILLVILPYWMWRHKFIIVMKIVHWIKKVEDDDGKKYDAFVSYKGRTDDENFVYRSLYPKLEKEFNFKLCLHERDFVPGAYIADQIVQAIENSRRTIIILSPEYATSGWVKFEFQKAQQEMLKLKHKIIPIMFKSIDEVEDLDINLKSLLGTITYIKYPGEESGKKLDRFWETIRLSMPKKRNTTSHPPNNSTCVLPEGSSMTTQVSTISECSTATSIESPDVISPETYADEKRGLFDRAFAKWRRPTKPSKSRDNPSKDAMHTDTIKGETFFNNIALVSESKIGIDECKNIEM